MTHAAKKPETLDACVEQALDLLRQLREQGRITLDLAPETVAELLRPLPAAAPAAPAAPAVGTPPPARASRPVAARKPSPPPTPPPCAAEPMPELPGTLEGIASVIASCQRCPLHQWRSHTVPGVGTDRPDILFIGEGPGRDEDAQGLPFVGRAGDLLNRLIVKMGYTRDTVFIGNVVKCRPTVNNEGKRDRPPTPEEMQTCLPYLRRQIEVLRPRVLVLLGNTALEGLFGVRGITRQRGTWREYEGIATMPTYHPSYLLRNGGVAGGNKAFWEVWEDMTAVLDKLGKQVPEPGRTR